MAAWLPRLAIHLPDDGQAIEINKLFDRLPQQVWLEIGFGIGDHMLAQLAAHPDVGFLGCEPFLNGVSKLVGILAEAEAAGDAGLADRLRLLTDDARLLLQALPTASIDRAFVLFPDPWPKKRHLWRRIVNPATLAQLARVLRPGGELRLATDVADYASWMLRHALAEPGLDWMAERMADWRTRPADWPASKYERKAVAAGRPCYYFRFRRSGAAPAA